VSPDQTPSWIKGEGPQEGRGRKEVVGREEKGESRGIFHSGEAIGGECRAGRQP